MIDAVLSYHLNPLTCGVAKFNQQLARRLGVPCLPLDAAPSHPLVSIKFSEMEFPLALGEWHRNTFDLLLHDRQCRPDAGIISRAQRVFYADEIGCPSTLDGNPNRGLLNVLLFGMAHKLNGQTVYLDRVRDLLDQSRVDYAVSVSTAVHEGTPWDGAFTTTVETLRHVFGPRLRVLGYLADDALARELQTCQAVALFFDPAARANNTTIWAALEAGCPLITNLDCDSPAELIHNETMFDLARLTDWPHYRLRDDVAKRGKVQAKGRSWDQLLEILRA
jgi:hypothetical protein